MQTIPLLWWIPVALGCALVMTCLQGQANPPKLGNKTPIVQTVVTNEQILGAMEPQVAVGRGKDVYVAFGAENTLYTSLSSDGGITYSVPTRVGTAGKLSLGMRRGPRIVTTAKGAVVTATYSKTRDGSDGDLLSWRTVDGGKTWLGPSLVNDVPGAAREGLHAMTVAPNGTIACAWLDLREPGTQVFAAFSHNGGKTWSKNVRVYRSPDGNVCECCHPSLIYDANNRLYVMWRNWLGGSRDMYLSSTNDDGKTFALAHKLGKGTWPLNACPMDGGALASSQGRITSVWRRENTLYLVPGTEANRNEIKVGEGQQGWIASTTQGTYLVWLRGRSGSSLLASMPGSTTPLVMADSAQNPVVAAGTGSHPLVVAVWSDKEGIRSATLATNP